MPLFMPSTPISMVKELCTAEGPAGDRREQTDFRTERLAEPGAVLAGVC